MCAVCALCEQTLEDTTVTIMYVCVYACVFVNFMSMTRTNTQTEISLSLGVCLSPSLCLSVSVCARACARAQARTHAHTRMVSYLTSQNDTLPYHGGHGATCTCTTQCNGLTHKQGILSVTRSTNALTHSWKRTSPHSAHPQEHPHRACQHCRASVNE